MAAPARKCVERAGDAAAPAEQHVAGAQRRQQVGATAARAQHGGAGQRQRRQPVRQRQRRTRHRLQRGQQGGVNVGHHQRGGVAVVAVDQAQRQAAGQRLVHGVAGVGQRQQRRRRQGRQAELAQQREPGLQQGVGQRRAPAAGRRQRGAFERRVVGQVDHAAQAAVRAVQLQAGGAPQGADAGRRRQRRQGDAQLRREGVGAALEQAAAEPGLRRGQRRQPGPQRLYGFAISGHDGSW
jgi:hypothetical protein